MHKNSIKGNAAEHLVAHALLTYGVPTWITGGNNKKWDIIFQIGEDEIRFGSVKYAKTRTPIFNASDDKVKRGFYFIVVPRIGEPVSHDILLFKSSDITSACKAYRKKAKKTDSYESRPNFRNFRIDNKAFEQASARFHRYAKIWADGRNK